MLPEVLLVCGDTGRDRVWTTNPLQLGCDLAVIQAGIIAAVAADELKGTGVAAFCPALNMRAD